MPVDVRQQRGRVLAQAQGDRIRQIEGDVWYVPSERTGGYLVDVEAMTCSCLDNARAKGRSACKHIWAANIIRGVVDAPPISASRALRGDLTAQEQANVRAALRYLRMRHGRGAEGWDVLARGTRLAVKSVRNVAYGGLVTARVVVRLARYAGVPVDDMLCGRFPPPGSCPHCGRGAE